MGLSGEATAGIVLGLIGLVAIVCLTLYTHRRLRTSTSTGEVTDLDDRLPNAPISSSHPASRIIPFGPKFGAFSLCFCIRPFQRLIVMNSAQARQRHAHSYVGHEWCLGVYSYALSIAYATTGSIRQV